MRWWRIRKVANAATWHLLMVALGVLLGIALVAFLPGMPWAVTTVTDPEASDLAAQHSMAAAAWWMVVISGTSTAVGGLGLYLIARTLQEAKRSADAGEQVVDATVQIGKRQVRAYLNIQKAKVAVDRNHIVAMVDADLRNSGQSPAKKIRGTATFRVVEFYTTPDGDVENNTLLSRSSNFQGTDVSAGLGVELRLTFGLLGSDPPLTRLLDGFAQRGIEIDIEMSYVDVFGDADTAKYMLGSMLTSMDQLVEGRDLRINSLDD
jgi:hypothetical protein